MRRLRGSFCRRTDRDSGRYHLLDADPPLSYTLEKYEIPSGRVRLVLPDKTTWTAFDIWEESHFFFFLAEGWTLYVFLLFCYYYYYYYYYYYNNSFGRADILILTSFVVRGQF